MNGYLFTAVLFLSLALTAGSMVRIYRLRKMLGENYLTSFFYFFLFISIYGFYGLWGSAFAGYVILPTASGLDIAPFVNLVGLMGLPFLAASWFMLARFSGELAGNSLKMAGQITWVILGLSAWIAVRLLMDPETYADDVVAADKLIVACIHGHYFIFAGLALVLARQEKTPWRASRPLFWTGFALIFTGLIQSLVLFFAGRSDWLDAAGCFFFFGSLVLPLLSLVASPPLRRDQGSESTGFGAFCRRYDITAREAEIILEIRQGKSNQEIADSLFISLQTVKDHAYKIFLKTGVKSRVQLVNMVDDYRQD